MSASSGNGGEAERLAPVIPLFGAAGSGRAAGSDGAATRVRHGDGDGGSRDDPESNWHTTWTASSARLSASPPAAMPTDAAFSDPETPESATAGTTDEPDAAEVRSRAERTLLKRLRGRSLSVREARKVLAENELAEAEIEEVVTAFLDNGYLDDLRLAEQLLDGALGRKAQGAGAIAQTLSRRGLERDVIDIALASLPDDEAERALEFARQRARGMSGLDPDTALRRLHGQLARRGFGGSTAMTAARQALDEAEKPAPRARVEFRPVD